MTRSVLMRTVVLTEVREQPTGDEDLALVLGEVVPELDRLPVVDLGRDRVGTLAQLLTQVGECPPLPHLRLVVVALVLERQRRDPLRDQVPAVDARERL